MGGHFKAPGSGEDLEKRSVALLLFSGTPLARFWVATHKRSRGGGERRRAMLCLLNLRHYQALLGGHLKAPGSSEGLEKRSLALFLFRAPLSGAFGWPPKSAW